MFGRETDAHRKHSPSCFADGEIEAQGGGGTGRGSHRPQSCSTLVMTDTLPSQTDTRLFPCQIPGIVFTVVGLKIVSEEN